MNQREPSTTFEAVRRQHLIDATIEALADVGFKATSLSQIARRANVSTGLFAHYFGDKDGLLEATLRFMATRLVRATRQRLRAATTPHERLYAVPNSALADQEFERRTSAVWLAFWGQIVHSTRYQRIQIIYQRRMLSNLRHDLRQLVPPHCVEPHATMIASMIDGVWIRSHASPTQTDGARARATVGALIEGLIAGAQMAPAEAIAMPVVLPHAATAPPPIRLVSPIAAESLGTFPVAREADIARALDKAGQGLAAWRQMSGRERALVLRRCADGLRADGDELARLDAICTGRSMAQTRGFGLPRAIQAFERDGILASRPCGEHVDLGAGASRHVWHAPLGIVAGLGHWSAPLLSACSQAAPALALGNAMIFQPAAEAPLSALRVAEILTAAGVPDGLFTVLTGDAETRGLLCNHSSIAKATASHPQPKSAMIVFADADMAQATRAVLGGCRHWMSAPDFSETSVFVQKSGLVAFRKHLLAGLRTMQWGDPRDPAVQIGAFVPAARLRDVLGQIDQAIAAGAKRLAGGLDGSESGGLTPTVLSGCTKDMPIVRQSQFAPVLTLLTFETDDDIVRAIAERGSDAPVGLFRSDIAQARQITNRLRTSLCCINDDARCLMEDGDIASERFGDTADPRYRGLTKRIVQFDRARFDV